MAAAKKSTAKKSSNKKSSSSSSARGRAAVTASASGTGTGTSAATTSNGTGTSSTGHDRIGRIPRFWWVVSIAMVIGVILFSATVTNGNSSSNNVNDNKEMTCETNANGETVCEATTENNVGGNEEGKPPSQQQQQRKLEKGGDKNAKVVLEITNDSPYRADIHWDDGRFGKFLAIAEANGGQASVNAFMGHKFFVTRHGVKEGLFDTERDVQYKYTVMDSIPPTQTFHIPKTAKPSSNPCQDRFSICPNEAARGSCQQNPGWMTVHCCKSCDPFIESSKYIDPKVRCTKEHLNMTDGIWQPGDLNDLFISWSTDPKFAKYSPTVWSAPDSKYGGNQPMGSPWVMTFDTFMTKEETDALIKGGKMAGFERSTDQGKMNALGEREKVVSKSRTSSNAWCVGGCERLPGVKSVTRRIEEVTNIPSNNYESFQILEYTNNQFYRMHHDQSSKNTSPSGPRILTFFLYLTDVEEGGATHFNKLNLSITPKRGRALIWPSVQDDDPTTPDQRMYHEAQPVIRGTKYAANHWIHYNDYMTPNIWGCTGSFS